MKNILINLNSPAPHNKKELSMMVTDKALKWGTFKAKAIGYKTINADTEKLCYYTQLNEKILKNIPEFSGFHHSVKTFSDRTSIHYSFSKKEFEKEYFINFDMTFYHIPNIIKMSFESTVLFDEDDLFGYNKEINQVSKDLENMFFFKNNIHPNDFESYLQEICDKLYTYYDYCYNKFGFQK